MLCPQPPRSTAGAFFLPGGCLKHLSFTLVALLIASCASRPSAPPVSPTPSPDSAQRQSRNGLTPIASAPKAIVEPRIRVGLLSDQPRVEFPRTREGYVVVSDGGPAMLRRGFSVEAPLANAVVRYAVQAGAISDLPSATAFVEKLKSGTGQRVDSVFDPANGLYRILVGEFADSQSATPLRDQLVSSGYGKDMLVVRRPSDATFDKALRLVDDEGDSATLRGQSILVMPADGDTVTIDSKPYRTAARLFINSRGLLNVINELNFEDYLLGVVPAEMGPKIYDELEALKAQAIAARTYAVRNLGQFQLEGYDICPGPACQAYKGFSGEEELSSRAVKETTGQILTYDGKPIDALYTATCGGETSDVGTMFPGRNEPYLRRARCIELDLVTLDGRETSALLTESQMQARVFAAMAHLDASSAWTAREVGAAVDAALRFTGGEPVTARPRSSRRRDVLEFLSVALRLDEKAAALMLPEDRGYFFPSRNDREAAAPAGAALLIKYGLVPAQAIDQVNLDAAMPKEELHALLLSWLREHATLSEATGKILAIEGRRVSLKSEGKTTNYQLPAGLPVFRRVVDRFQELDRVPVMLGDRASLLQTKQGPAAFVVQANVDGASFDRTSSFANWTRSYRADELVTSINRRNPIQQLVDLRPITIDASHRIAEMEVTAEGGRKFMLRGLPVRWSLNVPDNLFVYDKTKDADGVDRYTFFGKGWGHGTGFCQVGAYGMAFRGWKAEQILKNFYTGVELVQASSLQH
jgi:stage II sporulation protein D